VVVVLVVWSLCRERVDRLRLRGLLRGLMGDDGSGDSGATTQSMTSAPPRKKKKEFTLELAWPFLNMQTNDDNRRRRDNRWRVRVVVVGELP
jgi:hypothetical protein